MAWYRAGTATFTNGSKNVTGSGTAWVLNVRPGDEIIGPDDISREVEAVTADGALSMVEAYSGTTAPGAAYKVKPIQGWNRDVAAQLAALINDYGSIEAALTVLTGNVGLGVTPAAKLHVAGQSIRLEDLQPAFQLFKDSSPSKAARLSFNLAATDAAAIGVWNGATWNDALVVANNGNVGFGIAAPAARLHVQGAAPAQPAVTGSAPAGVNVRAKNSGSGLVLDIGGWGGNGNWLQSTNESDLSVTYPLLLNPNGGNVGIGTSTPAATLHVNGTLRVDGGTTGSASAGGAALPAQPAGFLTIILSGVERKLPYYLP